MKANDLMTRNPRTCEPKESLREVLAIMKAEDCGIVPIVEGNGELHVVGVVTDRDAALGLGERDAKPSAVRASEVMSTGIVQVSPDDDVSEVERRMGEAQVRRVLVCDNGRLLGVISTADLAREASKKETGRVIERISQAPATPAP